jgi:predicted glycosyltransferase
MGTSFQRALNMRSRLLLETVKEYRPHVVLVDHSPMGMKGEMLASLEWLKCNDPHIVTILGLRDIIDEPAKIITAWKNQGMFDALRSYYDNIWIYGSPSVFDPTEEYAFPDDIREKTRFIGYITESRKTSQQANDRSNGKFVLVTIGGGDGAGEAVIGTFLEMLKEHRADIGFESLIITGPFVSAELWRRFRREERGLPTRIRKFVAHTRPYLLRSDLVISTGGYNTTTEILTYARRALIIPRMLYRSEQFLRASRLAKLGLLTLLRPETMTSQKLFAAIKQQLASPEEPLSQARSKQIIELNGNKRLLELCGIIFEHLSSSEEITR